MRDGRRGVANARIHFGSMFDELLAANATYVDHFTLQGIAPAAAKQFALVTCMDSRIEPLAMLGLQPGDAKIMRNAGGRVTPDVLRSLVLAVAFLGVSEIAVMQHTNCALAGQSDADLRARLAKVGTEGADDWEFLAIVRECDLLPEGIRIEGWRYDVSSGAIERILTA